MKARNELFGMELGIEMLNYVLADQQKVSEVIGHLRESRTRLQRCLRMSASSPPRFS